ncbi:MAG: tetratricopeptide repeat protein [Firmicutes bacterium]|nr:tetratricopeptide repeat protein [Bacillota bacterium]
MGTELTACVGYNEHNIAYKFNTGIRVYSLEEALFHSYHNWKSCIDFFIEEGFVLWVRDVLKLSRLASEIYDIKKIDGICDRFLAFLNIIYYFDEEELADIEKKLRKYESRSKSEIFKEQGDALFKKNMFERAIDCYRLALKEDSENHKVINNIGLCKMQLGRYEEAVMEYERALELMPIEESVMYNLAEGYIFCERYKEAGECLERAAMFGKGADYYYYMGEICFRNREFENAAANYTKSIEIEKNEDILLKISDCYIRVRKYNDAERVLNEYGGESMGIVLKRAEIASLRGNTGGAVKIIEKSIVKDNKNSGLWTKLAQYYRKGYEFPSAERAVVTAMSFDKENREAELERARIKKAMGGLKEYREDIARIIDKIKKRYIER